MVFIISINVLTLLFSLYGTVLLGLSSHKAAKVSLSEPSFVWVQSKGTGVAPHQSVCVGGCKHGVAWATTSGQPAVALEPPGLPHCDPPPDRLPAPLCVTQPGSETTRFKVI